MHFHQNLLQHQQNNDSSTLFQQNGIQSNLQTKPTDQSNPQNLSRQSAKGNQNKQQQLQQNNQSSGGADQANHQPKHSSLDQKNIANSKQYSQVSYKLIENASQQNNLVQKKHNSHSNNSMILDSDMNNLDMAIYDMTLQDSERNQGQLNFNNQKFQKSNKKRNQQHQQIFGNNFDEQYFQNQLDEDDGFLGSFMKNEHQNALSKNQNFNQLDFFGNNNGFYEEDQIMMGEDDDQNLQNLSDHFGSQIVIMGGGGDDLNKIHQNFAGDTFSQISSTYEQQQQLHNVNNHSTHENKKMMKHGSINNNNFLGAGGVAHHQQSQSNEPRSHIQSKLHQYQEKNRPSTKVKMHNDELLDSMILNNLNDDMNTQRDNTYNNNMQNQHAKRNGNQILEFKSHKQSNKILGYPSSNSNLNNIIMNSVQLQQSDVHSQTTIYNSGIFDDASIMKILDKSISDDSLFNIQQQHLIEELSSTNKQVKSKIEIENSFMFECEDVKQILQNVSTKYKEKLQKQRQNGILQGGQLVGITFEELKSYDILASSAIEKLRQVEKIGKVIIEAQRLKSLSFKKYKQNLRIQIHNQIQKFKEICKKQYRQTENWKFKLQINEFETNEKVQQYEERFERQSDEINKLANRCEQLKYEKDLMAQKNEQKLKDMEKILKVVLKNLGSKDNERLNKINNSFCLGTDHSMLLQPRSRKKFQIAKFQSNDLQQSVDEKENESILSNQGSKIDNKEIKSYLEKVQILLKENRKYNQVQLKKNKKQQDQEGGSCFQSSQMLMNDNENQQSQFVPEEEAEHDRAFIDNQNQSESSKSMSYKPGDRMIDITEESVDYEFDQNQVLVMNQGDEDMEESKKSLVNLLDIQDKISAKDLKGQANYDQSPSERQMLQYNRQRMLQGQDKFNNQNKLLSLSNDNSINDDIQILGHLEQNNLKNELNSSNDFLGFFNEDQFKKPSQELNGTGNNIFILDGSNDQDLNSMSRNIMGQQLYSGGSSQLSIINAFPNSNRIQMSDEVFIVQVLDRKIPIPKLNINALKRLERQEMFDKNIPDVECTESSISQSEIQQSSVSYPKNPNLITDHQNITSFQNESISKQYQSQIENSSSSVKNGDGLLDQAVYHDSQSKSIKTHSSLSRSKAGPAAGMQNMFDSFKQELGMMDSIKQISSSKDNKQSQQNCNLNLDLDESLERDHQVIFTNDFKQQFQLVENPNNINRDIQILHEINQEKSLDLSINVSKFKKSLSDPNLMFNDVDSDSDEKQSQTRIESQNIRHENPTSQLVNNAVLLQNMKKLKTPQALQGKIRFNILKNDNQQKDESIQKINVIPNKLNTRKSLSQFQSKLRSSIGNNSRQGQDEQSHKVITQTDSSNASQQNPFILFNKAQTTSKDESLNKSPSQEIQYSTNQNIIRAISSTSGKISESDSQGLQSQETNSPLKKSQLIQNYIQGAASMNGSQGSKLSINKIFNPNRKNYQRNVQNQNHFSQQEIQQNLLNDKKNQDKNMMQEMKEHLESCDITQNNAFSRKKSAVKEQVVENDQSQLNGLSPSHKRTSQSHTPKKRDMIIVNNQQIKLGQKIKIIKPNFNIADQSVLNNGPDNESSVIRMSLPFKKITIQRTIIKKKNQNISVIDQTIDQSQMIPNKHIQNETFINGHAADNSIMINDISIIQPQISKGSIIQGLRQKSQIAKINSNFITPASLLQQNQNNSQLNISAINSSVLSKQLAPGMIQVKNIVGALPNQNFISQQIIEKIKKQKNEKLDGQGQASQTNILQNYNTNPNPVNISRGESNSKSLIKDTNSQSIEKLTKLPQRMMIMNPALLQQQKILQQQKLLQKPQVKQNDNSAHDLSQNIIDKNYHSVKNPQMNIIGNSSVNKLQQPLDSNVSQNTSQNQIGNISQLNIRRAEENNKLQNRRREIIERASHQQSNQVNLKSSQLNQQ
eukprot:403375860